MILIPTALEDRSLRGIPWVTLALISINAIALAITSALGAARANEVVVLRGLIEQTLEERPYLEPDARLTAWLEPAHRAEHDAGRVGGGVPSADQRRREQKEFDTLAGDFLAALDRLPAHRFGFVPSHPNAWGLLTAMFMHAGWIHLIGNMIFLYVAGVYVEDAYGRTLFLVAYLLSGLAASLGHYLASPQSSIPLVGASGAIAGVMGVVLVRFVRSWVRFLFLPIPFLPNLRVTLSLPALAVLPLWFGQQLYFAQRSAGDGGGVAWWAHIGGFAFGAMLAGAIRLLGLEERWQGRSIAADDVQRIVERAAAARAAEDFDRADRELGRALEADPESIGAWQEALELALLRDDSADLARAMTRLLEIAQRRGDAGTITALLRDERWRGVADLPPRLHLAIAGAFERGGDTRQALAHYATVVETVPRDPLALRALIRQCELLARSGQADAARAALERAMAHPAMSDAWSGAIDRARAKIG